MKSTRVVFLCTKTERVGDRLKVRLVPNHSYNFQHTGWTATGVEIVVTNSEAFPRYVEGELYTIAISPLKENGVT